MKSISKDEWVKIRKNGKIKYILFHWILSAAIPVAIIMPIVRTIFTEGIDYIFSSSFLRNVLMYIILCSFIAIILGTRRFKKYEREYFKY